MIIEGPDNAGKSTLVKHLLGLDPSLRVLHRDRFKPGQQETIGTSYLRALLPADSDRVTHGYGMADRLFASEEIYGELFRKGSRLTDAERFGIRNVLNSYGAIAVHVDAPDDVILANWTKREQLYDDPLVIARAYRERFASIFRTSTIVRYDWTHPKAESTRRGLWTLHYTAHEALTRALTWWSTVPYGVGKLVKPRIIMIGEGPSPNAKTSVPFANGPAGDFLAWAIGSIPNCETNLYLTNADKGLENNAAVLREELAFLAGPQTVVVTLGREAAQLYDFVKTKLLPKPLPVTELPHPQFWRRFHWARRSDYVKMLYKAIHSPGGTL